LKTSNNSQFHFHHFPNKNKSPLYYQT